MVAGASSVGGGFNEDVAAAALDSEAAIVDAVGAVGSLRLRDVRLGGPMRASLGRVEVWLAGVVGEASSPCVC